ncbi:hypothetical protein BKP37_01365 [Anaerobacillus alkalilacustris]|uniref:Polysulfide reductase n=1 Tax=Anaerobacillus alkalilacustris TaxID=393763 RepID=A0A1S2LXH5_9BACI|nr:NrfD/PsrC family molybdoenzyme membrane anchor subunit [Anaerobacillus alkalilacustris]OIJ17208.1 hypothetical protein BKP37_01365 [Anaerobacillus alkalilacustris]
MGTTNHVPWGGLIAGYVFFVVSSTGLSLVSSLGHVFKFKRFEVIGKRAVLGSIITLLMGFVVIGLELGNPFAMINILFTSNLKSAIFWMGLLYGVYLVLLCIEFFYMIKDDHKKSSFFGLLVLISAIAAHSNLGAVFGFLTARPYWTGPYMSIYFILSAFLSGVAILAIVYFVVMKVKDNETLYYRGDHILSSLGKLLVLFIGITMFFTTWKILTGLYGAVPGKYEANMVTLTGPLAMQFWFLEVGLGMVIPLVILSLPNGFTPTRVFIAGSMVIVGIFFMRIDLVFAGQMIPLEVVKGMEVEAYRAWSIAWAEWALIFGAIGGSILLYLIGEKRLNLCTVINDDVHTTQKRELAKPIYK